MRLKQLYKAIASCALVAPGIAFAQTTESEDPAIEEVVVTGSYIKRDKFDMASPVETFSAEDIRVTGAPTLGQFVRELSYTQNTDVVANVLSIQDGQQDSNSARFNLRGLGVDSTLTLFDGHRMIDTGNIGAVVPDIAMQRVEVVLDGGSAIYGTDAVAGVVNLIPVKQYDGFKVSSYYSQDEGGDLRQPKVGLLAGKTFDNGFSAVGALDYSRKTALLVADRPEYLAAYDDDLTTFTPGTWRGASGLAALGTYIDPDCGQYNESRTDDSKSGAFPSGYTGVVPGLGDRCVGEFGQFQDLAREAEDLNAYVNFSYEVNASLEIELQANVNRRESVLTGSPSVGDTTSNGALVVPSYHPANFQPFALVPRAWSPFQQIGTLPSVLEGGMSKTPYEYSTDRYKLAADYEIGDSSWEGETALSYQRYSRSVDSYQISMSRLQSALFGLGGPNCAFDSSALIGLSSTSALSMLATNAANAGSGGCEFFNPFGSADPRTTETYIPNSQALVDWLVIGENYEDTRNYLKYFQSHLTGEVFDLPAGAVRTAFGIQVREDIERDLQSNLELIGDDYNEPDSVFNTSDRSEVRSAFVEFDAPITSTFTMVLAARYEEFVDFDLETTTPKVSFRWSPLDNLALRASFGDSFVAPTASEISIQSNQGCSPLSFGRDPFLPGAGFFALAGADACSAGNPDLDPQTSYVQNFGISWRNDGYFQADLDYQTIEYEDRIVNLSRTDLLEEDFANMTAAGITSVAEWAESGLMNPAIVRDPTAGYRVTEITTYPDNASAIEVHVVDLKLRHGLDSEIGYFGVAFNATAYRKYDYTDFDGTSGSAIGNRNAETSLAPPITRWKANSSMSWRGENSSAALSVSYLDAVKFDGTFDESIPDLGGAPSANPKPAFAPEEISSHTVVDLRFGHRIDRMLGGNWDIGAGIRNLFDTMPDALPVYGGLETRLHSPWGREYYLEFTFEPDA
ncbi:TonB-dependent receptor [Proteobacteria bacterium 005FR1]|nr:TonB-dependent receptor [Proteobacteria bacterium 005FR1]